MEVIMQIKRVVVVADGHDLSQIVDVLESIGISPSCVHASRDLKNSELEVRGVVFDLAAGPLYVKKADSEHTSKSYDGVIGEFGSCN